jgi:hypothetical protein
MSHTVTAKVKYTYPTAGQESALTKTVLKMGGKVIGEGKHRLYGGEETGFGFSLPGWRYPLVLKPTGELKYDDFRGSWGDTKDLQKMQSLYGVEAARSAAEQLGWLTQEQPNGTLQVFHPSGGMITVGLGGDIDATNFTGGDCQVATEPLLAAMGGKGLETLKAEYFVEKANVQQQAPPG